LPQDAESFKKRMRDLVGATYWESPPAVVEFQEKHISPAGALVFALEHCAFTDAFPRWFGNIVGNCDEIEVRAYMIGNMFMEEVKDPTMELGHNESMWAFAEALGVTQKAIREHEPLISTTMALCYFDNVARTKPWLEAFAGLGCLELLTNAAIAERYGHVPINAKEPWAKLNLGERALSHWAAAEIADHGKGDNGPGHGEQALDLVAKFARTGEQQDRCARALREVCRVAWHHFDQIGIKAIEATRKAAKKPA